MLGLRLQPQNVLLKYKDGELTEIPTTKDEGVLAAQVIACLKIQELLFFGTHLVLQQMLMRLHFNISIIMKREYSREKIGLSIYISKKIKGIFGCYNKRDLCNSYVNLKMAFQQKLSLFELLVYTSKTHFFAVWSTRKIFGKHTNGRVKVNTSIMC